MLRLLSILGMMSLAAAGVAASPSDTNHSGQEPENPAAIMGIEGKQHAGRQAEPGGELPEHSYWATVSDEKINGQWVIQGIVEINANGDQVTGRILVPFVDIREGRPVAPHLKCSVCEGKRHNEAVIGLPVIQAHAADDGEYEGEILDPSDGETYSLTMWLAEQQQVLKVRGYIMFFYRTQSWYRISENAARQCARWFMAQPYAKGGVSEAPVPFDQYAAVRKELASSIIDSRLQQLCH